MNNKKEQTIMKKLISLVLVLTLMLSFGAISAFATATVDGESKGGGKVTYYRDGYYN